MRIPTLALCAVLVAGSFASVAVSDARAELPGSAPSADTRFLPVAGATLLPQPATQDEERAYAQREAESPADVTEYTGGFIIAVLVVVALVLLIIYLLGR